MKRSVTTNNTNTENIDVIATKLDYIQRDIVEIKVKLESEYVTQDEFEPVKKIVYGMVGVILLAVIGALITLVLRQT